MILADRRHQPKVRQGVTTEVFGVDGTLTRRSEPGTTSSVHRMNAGLDGAPHIDADWAR